MKPTRIAEDAVWRYYNCPDPFWSAKCGACRDKVALRRAPVEECLNCWKVEVWSPDPGPLDALVDGLLARGIPVVAKASRAPILIVRSGVPREAYPAEQVDYLLILYGRDIAERDALRREAEAVLRDSDSLGHGAELLSPQAEMSGPDAGRPSFRPVLPVRRGCWRYDDALGPWQSWYPIDEDFPGE